MATVADIHRWKKAELNARTAEANARARAAKQQGQGGGGASEWAMKFMNEWNAGRTKLTGYINTAMRDVDKGWGLIDEAKPWIGEIGGALSDIKAEYADYKSTFRPLEQEAITTASEALGTERGFMGKLRDLSEADYEGVSGMAKADVGSEMEKGRRAEARRLQGLGLDPGSGASRGSMRRSRVDEAIGKVLAANQARLGEKRRVADVVTAGIPAIGSGGSGAGGGAYGIAKNIREGAHNLLGMRTQTASEAAKAQTGLAQAGAQLARTRGDIADTYGRNVVAPVGEMAASTFGTAMAKGGLRSPSIPGQRGYSPWNRPN